MKRIIYSLLLALFSFSAYCQDTTAVVTVPNQTAAQLYKGAKQWIALNFKSAQDVIQFDDSASKKIIVKGKKILNPGIIESVYFSYRFCFALELQFKDGRYKYTFSNSELIFEKTNTPMVISDFRKYSTFSSYKQFLTTTLDKKALKIMTDDKIEKWASYYHDMITEIDNTPIEIIKNLTEYLNNQQSKDNW